VRSPQGEQVPEQDVRERVAGVEGDGLLQGGLRRRPFPVQKDLDHPHRRLRFGQPGIGADGPRRLRCSPSDTGPEHRTSPEFDVPTTAALFGSDLYVVNARLSTPRTPETEYTS
jgi:hypothetical protein